MPGQPAAEIPGGWIRVSFSILLHRVGLCVGNGHVNQAPLVDFFLGALIGRDKPTNLECRARIIIKYVHFNLSKPL